MNTNNERVSYQGMTTAQIHQQNLDDKHIRMYGMTTAEIEEQYVNTLTFKIGGIEMTVMGILSDCQELGVSNTVRQQLNIAKFLLGQRMPAHIRSQQLQDENNQEAQT
jgi:hypothetical protein